MRSCCSSNSLSVAAGMRVTPNGAGVMRRTASTSWRFKLGGSRTMRCYEFRSGDTAHTGQYDRGADMQVGRRLLFAELLARPVTSKFICVGKGPPTYGIPIQLHSQKLRPDTSVITNPWLRSRYCEESWMSEKSRSVFGLTRNDRRDLGGGRRPSSSDSSVAPSLFKSQNTPR